MTALTKSSAAGDAAALAPSKPKRRRARAITLGKGPSKGFDQAREYGIAMQVKRGELVWSPLEHKGRFGSPGDFVTPARALELVERQTAFADAPPIGGRMGAALADIEAFANGGSPELAVAA